MHQALPIPMPRLFNDCPCLNYFISRASLLTMGLTLLSGPAHAGTDHNVPVWAAAAELDFKTARSSLPADPQEATDPESRLMRALMLIVTPPQTETRLDAAAAQLHELSRDSAAGDIAAVAAYQYARLIHTRGTAADEELIAHYRDVWTRFPGTMQAERAFVFAVIVRQYRAHESAEAKRAAMLQWDEDAQRMLHTDAGRRLYHLAASMAWARLLQDDERASTHLEVVHSIGLSSQYTFSDVIFRLGEYHRRRGDKAGAIRYFNEFVEHYPVDRRTDLARRLIRQLSSNEND